jgi:hypothetical protein
MNSVDKLFKLADRFTRKMSLGQDKLPMPAQPGDIADALENAGLWSRPDDIFPLADAAGLSAEISVVLTINVDANLNVTFGVQTTPPTPAGAAKLKALLTQKYSASFKPAIQAWFTKNKIIPRPVSAGWHKFGPAK